MLREDCEYCRQWNLSHPAEAARLACGPCDVCQAPGHIMAHPRQPTSVCLCQQHAHALGSSAYHFELYHLIYVLIFGLLALQLYPLLARLLGF